MAPSGASTQRAATSMELIELSQAMLDSLEKYDESILPLGLYASDEVALENPTRPQHREWKDALLPAIRTTGGVTDGKLWERSSFFYEAYPTFPELGVVSIEVLRYSKIKVRKYGSGYQVDRHEDRSARWESTDLSGHISSLWKQRDAYSYMFGAKAKLLIFIGFDKTFDPLRRELVELQQSLRWEEKNVSFVSRAWHDKAGRGFGVRLCSWARAFP